MKTKLLMTASAAFLFALGVVFSFLPQETLIYLGGEPGALVTLLVQVAGALYLGFAAVNWTARASLIGGIYNRAVALGNFLHFGAATAALAKAVIAGQRNEAVLAVALIYTVFAVWFGKVLFTHPVKDTKD
jgi:hypothetical protein